MHIIRDIIGDAPVVVFSDDPKAAETELAELEGIREFVCPPSESCVLEILQLMSGGHGIVIANSSFSWWSTWLGDKFGRPVVAPRPWSAGAAVNTDDLLPPHLVTLGL